VIVIVIVRVDICRRRRRRRRHQSNNPKSIHLVSGIPLPKKPNKKIRGKSSLEKRVFGTNELFT